MKCRDLPRCVRGKLYISEHSIHRHHPNAHPLRTINPEAQHRQNGEEIANQDAYVVNIRKRCHDTRHETHHSHHHSPPDAHPRRQGERIYAKVPLTKPLNWIPGPELLDRVIGTWMGKLSDYDAESWAKFVLDKCKGNKNCYATSSFQCKGIPMS